MANQAHHQSQPREPSADLARLSATSSDGFEIMRRLEEAATHFNLITPSTACGVVPEGCSIVFAATYVPESETYKDKQSGNLVLHRVALDKIAATLGITWDGEKSRRTDDGSDPRYCQFTAVGYVREFDGTLKEIFGTKEMDVRDGSEQANDCQKRGANTELANMRKHIVAHAETKARLRATASLGIKRSYTPEELRKPFVCVKLAFTGETSDPELRRAFALKRADAMLGGAAALYGRAPALPAAPQRGLLPPPPAVIDAEAETPAQARRPAGPPPAEDWGDDSPPPRRPAPGAGPAVPPQGTTAQAAAADGVKGARPRTSSTMRIPGGRAKDTPLAEAEDRDIAYWADRIGKELAEGTSRDVNRSRALCNALNAERDWRLGVDPSDQIPF